MGMRIFGLLALLSLSIGFSALGAVEERGSSTWPTANDFRIPVASSAPAGKPVWVDAELPVAFNPDSVRVIAAGGSGAVIPAKTNWQRPNARISWLSTGASGYHVYFDTGSSGETERLPSPAMVGVGDRVTYGRGGVRNRLGVGLWAHPAPVDMDRDGNLDLIVSCPDNPFNGIWYFRNLGANGEPLFDRGEWLGPAKKDLVAADANGDGNIDLIFSGGYYSDVAANQLSKPVKVDLPRDIHIGRDDLWHPVDWDGDGSIDFLTGVSDWRDYGWDDAFNSQGEWTRGPLHGYIYFHRNLGTNQNPRYAAPVKLQAGGRDIDQYGSPIPNPVDWDGDGDLDLLGSDFIDTVTFFRNDGSRRHPQLRAGELLEVQGAQGSEVLKMDLCMIQPRVVRWHPDGRPSLVIGEEDGTVALVENLAPKGQTPRLAPPRYLEQVDPFVKSGALSRPVAVDWNGDGLLDIISGDSAGYIRYFQNTGSKAAPVFEDRGLMEAAGKVIRRVAGANRSIQGPAEAKWGYSNPSVIDWDLDGDLDILVNDIWGEVVWYRNDGTRTNPRLAAAQNIEVEWTGRNPKPDWVWWEPQGKQLLTQWRTTPKTIDWDGDGLPDLVMLNHQGYLSLFRRARRGGKLVLLEPERIFVTDSGRFLNLAGGRAGSSGRRKIEFVDWDSDGDMDLIVDSNGGPLWYENVGSQQKPAMRLRGPLVQVPLRGHSPTPNVADWTGDGKPDLLIGGEDGHFYFFEHDYIQQLAKEARQAQAPR